MNNTTILRGWKEIEAFLGVGRQAIVSYGYPVRKDTPPGSNTGRVFAIVEELVEYAKNRRLKT